MKTYQYNDLSADQKSSLLKRPKLDFTSIFEMVTPILDAVEERGDDAVREFTAKFDGKNECGLH